ncbi:glycosyltransferase [Hydrocarboniphaga sp.]|uniref:glycosyltransferase n=1 Tax=Hydrocarboniphaga sp. TaxID=2033016 RepID=UPI003D09B80F
MSRPLRLLHQIHLAHDAWGGMEKQFAHLLQATAQDARVSHYLSEDLRDVAPGVAAALSGLRAPAADTRRWHGMTVPNWRGMRQSRQASQARSWNIDAVLSWNRFGDPRPLRLAHRIGAASVYWECGAAWHARSRVPEEDFLRGFDGYIANSQACAAMLRYWGVTAPIEICSPGIYRDDSLSSPTPRPIANGPLRLGFCAPLQAFKGGVLAVHALAALRRRGVEATLSIAGDGPERASIERVAQRLGIADLQFLGQLSVMHEFYAGIDLLLHPALCEPWGNACAEALIAGVPVVATVVDGLPEVIRDGVDGVLVTPSLSLAEYADFGGDAAGVYPRVWRPDLHRVAEPGVPDPEALADAVLRIAGDSHPFAKYRDAALASAPRFDHAAHVTRLLQLIGRAGSRRREQLRSTPPLLEQPQLTVLQQHADQAAQLVIELLEGQTFSRRVADIGCGTCRLREALARLGTPCEYRGYDRLPRSADVTAFDPERDRLPQPCDVAVMLGVSEFLPSLVETLQRLRQDAAALVISHTLGDRPRSADELQRIGWHNYLSRADFEKQLAQAGWLAQRPLGSDDGRSLIWACVRSHNETP